jgi:putative N-acetylmannosamine-6-phosphate epimerase
MSEKCRLAGILEKRFALLVSIPRNDPALALAAQKGGADALKVHLNVEHFASGTRFGPWQEEKENIRKILDAVSIPVGLLPGADTIASLQEISEAAVMGVDFLDSFAHHMPAYLWGMGSLGVMLAVNRDYSPGQVKALEEMGTDFFEATVLPHEEYRLDLNLKDLSLYHQLAHSTSRPLVVPTQKKIRPAEVPLLKKAGASGIVIGVVVTGHGEDEVFQAVRAFRQAIDRMDTA